MTEANSLDQEAGKARSWALRGVDITISPGEIVGFIGPNGAGKTTLIKLMSGLIGPSEGEIEVLGRTLGRGSAIPDGIGLVAENQSFIPYLSGYRNLRMLAGLRAVATDEDVAETMRLVDLDPGDGRPTRSYSLGMRQRLGLAQALMERPRLLLLDEPTNGLDPAGVVQLRELLRRLATAGVAVFLASHLLTEVEKVCDRVLLVKDGRVVSEIEQRRVDRPERRLLHVTFESETDIKLALSWCKNSGIIVSASGVVGDRLGTSDYPQNGGYPYADLYTGIPTPDVISALVEIGVRLESVVKKDRSLEEQFMELIKNAG